MDMRCRLVSFENHVSKNPAYNTRLLAGAQLFPLHMSYTGIADYVYMEINTDQK